MASRILIVLTAVFCLGSAPAGIINWQTGETITGTEEVIAQPGVVLEGWSTEIRNLRYADFSRAQLNDASALCSS
jgi:hypothetical protein